MSAGLRFRHDPAGFYVAYSDTHRYTIDKNAGAWRLQVRELITTAGVRHATGQPNIACGYDETKGLAVAVANAYHALGEDFQSVEHGWRSRYTVAVAHAYDDTTDTTTTEEQRP